MTCPKCGGKTYVLDSRESDPEFNVRKRCCQDCKYKFVTKEYEADLIEHMMALSEEAERRLYDRK